jgi:hypothetical protein
VNPPLDGNQLGVGCTDPYGSSLNGSRPMGRKSEVNATTGVYPMPPGGGGSTATVWNQRAAVAEADLDAALNPKARYFIEGQYIAPDDAQSGNGLNNASYREVSVAAGTFNLSMVGNTVREKSAIEVWPVVDPAVELVNVDVPSVPVERFHVARKVTNPSAGVWHYEYAVHNLNSDRAADRLAIRFFGATTFENIGFHDVNAHSNEPYDTTDWSNTVTADELSWDSPSFSPASNANAIRWATMYNFWFDADRPPSEIQTHVLGLFETGTPEELEFLTNSERDLHRRFRQRRQHGLEPDFPVESAGPGRGSAAASQRRRCRSRARPGRRPARCRVSMTESPGDRRTDIPSPAVAANARGGRVRAARSRGLRLPVRASPRLSRDVRARRQNARESRLVA